MATEQEERAQLAYQQNFEQFRSLNGQMNRIPALAMTLTGGLWFGAGATAHLDTEIRFLLLMFAGLCNLTLVLAAFRVRDVLESYLEKLKAFDSASFVSGKPSAPRLGKLGSYSMISAYSFLLVLSLVCSPKTEPGVMRVLSGREAGKDCHETQTSNARAGHRPAA
ncbi:MAG: hypothetical protein M5U25_13350 [Planctomycetota bacterium]|nr:hypothetical protein [Planctomycetota bacterium]